MRSGVLLLAAIASASACGRVGFDAIGDPTGAGDATSADVAFERDPNGSWIIRTARFFGESTWRDRDDLSGGLRSDVTIDGSTLFARHIVLEDGLAVEGVADSGTIEVEVDGTWLVTGPDQRGAYDVTWRGRDELEIRWLASDPRNLNFPVFTEAVLERTQRHPQELIAPWQLRAAEYPGTGEFAAGDCAPDGSGASWRVFGTLDIPASFIIQLSLRSEAHADTSCGGLPVVELDDGLGYLEVDGTSYRVWLDLSSSGRLAVTGTVTPSAGGYRFVQATCHPAASCGGIVLMLDVGP